MHPLGNPLKFLDETCPVKTRGMELLCGKKIHNPNFNPFLTDPPVCDTDRRTDRRTGDSSALSIMLYILSYAKSDHVGRECVVLCECSAVRDVVINQSVRPSSYCTSSSSNNASLSSTSTRIGYDRGKASGEGGDDQ